MNLTLLQKLTKKQKQILAASVLVLFFIILYVFGQPKQTTSTKGGTSQKTGTITNIFSVTDGNQVTITTTPIKARVYIQELREDFGTPKVLDKYKENFINLTISRSGYFTKTVAENLEPLKQNTEITLHYNLVRAPQEIYTFKTYFPESVNGFVFSEKYNQFTLYRNSVERRIEFGDGQTIYTLRPDIFNGVGELRWLREKQAVVNAGNLAPDKVSYLVDFNAWNDASEPKIDKLPQTGIGHDLSDDGYSLAFYGNINYDNSTATVFIYNLVTKTLTPLNDTVINVPIEVRWLGRNRLLVVSKSPSGDADYTSTFLVRMLELTNNTWQMKDYLDNVNIIAISPNKGTVLNVRNREVYYNNPATGEEKLIHFLPDSDARITYYNETTALIAYTNPKNETFVKLVDLVNGQTDEAQLDFLKGPEEHRIVTEIKATSQNTATLSFSDGTVSVIKLY